MKTGTIVDATIIASASEDDGDGRWVKHRGKPAAHGFKAHVGCDADTALVERISVTPANVNDGRAGPEALPDDPDEVFADSAYRGQHFGGAVRAKGGTPRVVLNAMWGRDEQETLGRLRDWNRPIYRVRGRIEKIFGTWKRSDGLRRMQWRGLAKATAQSTSPPSPMTSSAPSTSLPRPPEAAAKTDRIGRGSSQSQPTNAAPSQVAIPTRAQVS